MSYEVNPWPLCPQATTDLLSVSIVLPFLELHIHGVYAWLFKHSIILLLKFILVIKYVSSFFSFYLLSSIPLCGYITFCFCLPALEYLGYFHI